MALTVITAVIVLINAAIAIAVMNSPRIPGEFASIDEFANRMKALEPR